MTKRVYTCIICPAGCEITVEHDGENIISVSGNTCKRGENYVRTELTAPVRTLTTTVLTLSGVPVPVKSSKPVPKGRIFDCMAAVNSSRAPEETKPGDIIIENICDTGADIVATGTGGIDKR